MKILVTGGAGFVGSHIVDMLIERGHIVFIADDFSSGKRDNLNPKAIHVMGDILDESQWRAVRGDQFDAICHQAAQPSLLTSVKDPRLDADINILGTINVIEAANRVGAHLVMASTSAVYDNDAPLPFTEGSRKHPTRPYGIAKYAAEMYVQCLVKSYAILRYGNVYGPRQVAVGENQLVPHALNHIYKGAPFTVNGDGGQTRDFVFVRDIARANVVALESKARGTFNAATGEGRSVNDVLSEIKQLTEFKRVWDYGPAKQNEPRHVALNPCLAAGELLGWESEISLWDGLRETVEWYRSENG